MPKDQAWFDARELVDYAKAVLSNLELLREFEGLSGGRRESDHSSEKQFARSYQNLSKLERAHAEGRVLGLRRLHPDLTDEGIELRLSRVSRMLHSSHLCSAAPHPAEKFEAELPLLFKKLADTFLSEARDGSIRVRAHLLSLWQDLVLVVPPFLVMSAWMAAQISNQGEPVTATERSILVERMRRWITDSTLPLDDDVFLDAMCERHGLDEVHMHLNGTTEAERIWIDALARPEKVVGGLTEKTIQQEIGLHVGVGNGVNRLLQQEDRGLSPTRLLRRVITAARLKARLLREAADEDSDDELPVAVYRRIRDARLQQVSSVSSSALLEEAWLLIVIDRNMRRQKSPQLGLYFWHYVLLRAQFCRLLVQQRSQKGFDQFQHITLNELREATEKEYAERFRQIERGHQRNVDFLEGRFAPKPTPAKMAELIGRMLRGYLQFLREDAAGQKIALLSPSASKYSSLSTLLQCVRSAEQSLQTAQSGTGKPTRRLRLGLVPHFIKRSSAKSLRGFLGDASMRPICRDVVLRRETDQAARALIALMRSTPGLDTMIRGIDAASNERHAGPEVFAPAFRRMREAGINRFTYHAGEDFGYLVSGLRAMVEAVEFLELGTGCRIGHGTAAGISPKKWWAAVQDFVVMPVECRLDDLVFARRMLLQCQPNAECLPLLESEIERLAMRIWQDPQITIDILDQAWLLRSLDPLAQESRDGEVEPMRKQEFVRFKEAEQRCQRAHQHYLRRHGIGASREELARAREEIVVSSETDVLRPKVMRMLQRSVLQLLARRQIAIETLPSSNVRISIHKEYEDHHILNWVGTDLKDGADPKVAIGSDDPGIFATGLRIEYAHVLRILKKEMGQREAERLVEQICLDAKVFRF